MAVWDRVGDALKSAAVYTVNPFAGQLDIANRLQGGGGITDAFKTQGGGAVPTSQLDPTQAPYLADLYQRTQAQLGQPSVAGFDPLQTAGQQQQLQAAANLSPQIQNFQNNLGFLASGAGSNPLANPYLQQTANAAINPLFQQLAQQTLPGIRSGAAASGNVGSSRQGIAEGLAQQGAFQAAGNTLGNIYSNAFQQGQSNQLQALSMTPDALRLGFLPGQVASDIGAQRQQLAQAQLDAPLNQLAAARQIYGPAIQQTIGQAPTTPSTFSQLLELGVGAGSLALGAPPGLGDKILGSNLSRGRGVV